MRETYEDAQWTYELEEPFEIPGAKVTELKPPPPRWTTLENMKSAGGLNTGAAKAGMIAGCIIGIKDASGKEQQAMLSMVELDEMSKIDLENITARMDENAIGPNMAIEGDCPRCRSNYVTPIDWSYDNFFGSSSR